MKKQFNSPNIDHKPSNTAEAFIALQNENDYLKKTFLDIAQGIESEVAESFFVHLVQYLARVLKCSYAFIAEVDHHCVKTIAMYKQGEMIEQFEYNLEHTPCENVVNEKRLCCYQEFVQNLFPLDSDLTRFDIQSYLGIPLLHVDGSVIGILVVMNDQPIHDKTLTETILKIFSFRASAELIRLLEEKKLKISEQNLLTLIHTMPDIVVFKDGKGRWVEANNTVLQLFELEQDTYKGKTNSDFQKTNEFHREMFITCEETDQEAWEARKPIIFEEEIKRSNGASLMVEYTKVPVFDHKGNRQWLIVIGRDITDRKLVQDNLIGQNDILEMIAKGKPIGDILHRIIELVEQQSGAICSILLLENEQLKHCAAPNLPESYVRAIDGVEIGPVVGSCGTAAFYNTKIIVSDIGNDPLWNDYRELALVHGLRACWSVPITDKKNQVLGTFAMYYKAPHSPQTYETKLIERAAYLVSLVLERDKAEATIRHMAFHDSLTKLPNRKSFQHMLEKAIVEAKQNDQIVSVLYLDLDRFKMINDSMGHSLGDVLLQNVSDRLKTIIMDRGVVSRQGGDEFTILLPGTSKEETEVIAKSIMVALTIPFHIQDQDLYISTSIGISLFPLDGSTFETLIKHADIAMYQAKKQGENLHQFYVKENEYPASEHVKLYRNLRKALDNNEFVLVYQPQYDIETKEFIGVEALIRWNHPEKGIIFPLQFIPFAEEVGLIVPIGKWVLHEACKQWRLWMDHNHLGRTLKMSVNLSSRQMYEPDLIELISKILNETGMDPHSLEIEVTESITMNLDRATMLLSKLKGIGVSISIDDFGTGFSSLAYLKNFPIDRIKIDRTFIKDLSNDISDQNIVKTIIALGINLNLKVIAEGVESEDQLNLLRNYGCHEAQGYFLGHPMSADHIAKIIYSE
ncbi:EAL domain-containing protein [Paenibacillus sp. LMG 31458]|uniref:EAL domain-containing protein n=1 Tax=Paenibacillus phytorum TaxID=2654977 RepID=A0ABX1XRF6_9BACL|nr:EAL domain-containing protein [Paenibacillus phytorum]NOU71111.1 EAL domain-containing protein [Paenibacillus phytorum]